MAGGLIFLLIGPSGTGKSSIIRNVLKSVPDLRRYTTYTTRPPRAGEVDGREYYFVDRDRFEELVEAGKLVEWQAFYGQLYGSSRELLESFLQNDVDGIAAYDVLGSKELADQYPNNIITIFILPPSAEALRTRLVERCGSETPEGRLRLERFDMEMAYAGRFKYVVQNTKLEQATTDVECIIRAEQCARLAQKYGLRQSQLATS
jgi:guanylate kinase